MIRLFLNTAIVLIFLSSCLHPVYYNIKLNNGLTTIKTNFTNGKIVQRFFTIPYHGGSIAIYHDFTFEKNLIISVKDSYVSDHKGQWRLNFVGRDIKKDTIHIDGDANLTTVFSVPPWYRPGDTIQVHFEGFSKDIDGNEYNIDPIYLVLNKGSRRK